MNQKQRRCWLWSVLYACLASGLPAEVPSNPTIEFLPKTPFVAVDEHSQYLNVDLQVSNPSPRELRLERIELSVFDGEGRLVLRRFLADGPWVTAGIRTIPERRVPASGVLMIFNPFHRFDADVPLKRLRFDLTLRETETGAVRNVAGEVTPASYRPATRLVLPISQRSIVYDGYDFYSHHRRIDISNPRLQAIGFTEDTPVRYAVDLCVVDEAGALYTGSASNVEDWHSYGAEVRAPAAGVVVSVANDVPDNGIRDGELIYPDGEFGLIRRILGNHVVIDHGGDEYSVLAHLLAGTIEPALGERVEQGQKIGRIGFSGDTGLHVHLHYHLASGPGLTARALPSYFDAYLLGPSERRIRGDGRLETGQIVRGMPRLANTVEERRE